MVDIKRNSRFWFDTTMQGNFHSRWPFSGKRGYETDLAGSIYAEDYGKSFKDIKTDGSIDKILNGPVRNVKNLISPEIRGSFNLVNAGYTSGRIMGKEWDAQINEHAGYELERRGLLTSAVADTDKQWRKLGTEEEFTSVKEFLNLMTAERLANDENLIDTLKTKEELESEGYKLGKLASKVVSVGGEDYYDISMAQQNERPENKAPTLAVGDAGKVELNDLNLDLETNFDTLLQRISAATGAKFVANPSLPVGTIDVKVSKLRTAGRKVVNYFRAKFNTQRSVMPQSVQISYSSQGTKEEQAYSIIKEVARLSTNPYISRVKKIISNGGGYNLPNIAEFVANENVLKEFSTSLIASEMATMFAPTRKDAKILRDFFKLDAAQTLSTVEENNTWLVPLASGFVSTSVNRCASNLNFSADEYREITGVAGSENTNFYGALFAKNDTVGRGQGLYSILNPLPEPEDETVPEPPFGVAESGPIPDYDDRAFRAFNNLGILNNSEENLPPTTPAESDPMPEYDDRAFRMFNNMGILENNQEPPYTEAESDPMPNYNAQAFQDFNNLGILENQPYMVAESEPTPYYADKSFRSWLGLPPQTTTPFMRAKSDPMPEYDDRAFRAFNSLSLKEQEELPYMFAESDDEPDYDDRAFRQFNNMGVLEPENKDKPPYMTAKSDPMPDYNARAFRKWKELPLLEEEKGPYNEAESEPIPDYDDNAFRDWENLYDKIVNETDKGFGKAGRYSRSRYNKWNAWSKSGFESKNGIERDNSSDDWSEKTWEAMYKACDEVYSYVWKSVNEVLDDKFKSLSNDYKKEIEELAKMKQQYENDSGKQYLIDKKEAKLLEFKQRRKDFATFKSCVGDDRNDSLQTIKNLEDKFESGDKYSGLAIKVHDLIGDVALSVIDIAGADMPTYASMNGKQVAQKIIASEYGKQGSKTGKRTFKADMKKEIDNIFNSTNVNSEENVL